MYSKYYLILSIATFLAIAGSNSRVDACFLAMKQSLPCGCVQFRGGRALAPPSPRPPLMSGN